jgi:hypothetical protein
MTEPDNTALARDLPLAERLASIAKIIEDSAALIKRGPQGHLPSSSTLSQHETDMILSLAKGTP